MIKPVTKTERKRKMKRHVLEGRSRVLNISNNRRHMSQHHRAAHAAARDVEHILHQQRELGAAVRHVYL